MGNRTLGGEDLKGTFVGVLMTVVLLALGIAVGASTGFLSNVVNAGRPHVGDTEANLTPEEQAGKQIVMTTCVSCHGSDLKGQVGPNLYQKSKELSEAQIEDVIRNGYGRMPSPVKMGLVSPDKVSDVAAYIKSLSRQQ
jgi:cytochrome c550